MLVESRNCTCHFGVFAHNSEFMDSAVYFRTHTHTHWTISAEIPEENSGECEALQAQSGL